MFTGQRMCISRLTHPVKSVLDAFVSISVDRDLLTPQFTKELNPMSIKIKSVKNLPNEPVEFQQLRERSVLCVIRHAKLYRCFRNMINDRCHNWTVSSLSIWIELSPPSLTQAHDQNWVHEGLDIFHMWKYEIDSWYWYQLIVVLILEIEIGVKHKKLISLSKQKNLEGRQHQSKSTKFVLVQYFLIIYRCHPVTMSYDFLKHATHSTKGKPQDKNLYWDDLNVVCSCSLQGIMNIVACSNSRIS